MNNNDAHVMDYNRRQYFVTQCVRRISHISRHSDPLPRMLAPDEYNMDYAKVKRMINVFDPKFPQR